MIARAIKTAFAHVTCAAFLTCVRAYCVVRLAYYRIVIEHLGRHRPTHSDLTALHAHAMALDDYLRADYPLNIEGGRRA